jgi:hypothetical protein
MFKLNAKLNWDINLRQKTKIGMSFGKYFIIFSSLIFLNRFGFDDFVIEKSRFCEG